MPVYTGILIKTSLPHYDKPRFKSALHMRITGAWGWELLFAENKPMTIFIAWEYNKYTLRYLQWPMISATESSEARKWSCELHGLALLMQI